MREHHVCMTCGGNVTCEAFFISTMGYGWKSLEGIIPGINTYWSCPVCIAECATLRNWFRVNGAAPAPALLQQALQMMTGLSKLVRCMSCMEGDTQRIHSLLPAMRVNPITRYFGPLSRKTPGGGVLPETIVTLSARGMGDNLIFNNTPECFLLQTQAGVYPHLCAKATRGWPAIYTEFLACQDFPFPRDHWDTFIFEATRWEQRAARGDGGAIAPEPLQRITLPKGAVRCLCNNCKRLQVNGEAVPETAPLPGVNLPDTFRFQEEQNVAARRFIAGAPAIGTNTTIARLTAAEVTDAWMQAARRTT